MQPLHEYREMLHTDSHSFPGADASDASRNVPNAAYEVPAVPKTGKVVEAAAPQGRVRAQRTWTLESKPEQAGCRLKQSTSLAHNQPSRKVIESEELPWQAPPPPPGPDGRRALPGEES